MNWSFATGYYQLTTTQQLLPCVSRLKCRYQACATVMVFQLPLCGYCEEVLPFQGGWMAQSVICSTSTCSYPTVQLLIFNRISASLHFSIASLRLLLLTVDSWPFLCNLYLCLFTRSPCRPKKDPIRMPATRPHPRSRRHRHPSRRHRHPSRIHRP
jgi:hypothetical protein